MFGIGLPELFIVLVIALVVLGPEKLPDLARAIGKGLGEFRRATDELKQTFNDDDELRELKRSLNEAKNEMSKMVREETKDINVKELTDSLADGSLLDAMKEDGEKSKDEAAKDSSPAEPSGQSQAPENKEETETADHSGPKDGPETRDDAATINEHTEKTDEKA